MATPLLCVENLRACYGRLVAVRSLSLNVPVRGAVAIVGPNGAGKSTTLTAIAGGLRDVSGSVMFDGTSILGMEPESIARRGISLVPEGRHVFASLTVRENLLIAGHLRSRTVDRLADLEKVLTYFPKLRERVSQSAGKLSGGEQQMLVIGRALMTRPKILLIDEPSLGLAPKIIDEVYDILLALRREKGMSLLINEQNSRRVLKYMDDIYVVREGTVQSMGKCRELEGSHEMISDAYFGHGAFARGTRGGALA